MSNSLKSQIVSLYANSPVHIGAGNSVGIVDSPIMRERHTKIPIIPGSSLKGVLADFWYNEENYEENYEEKGKKRKNDSEVSWLFGAVDRSAASAGALLIGEARVILFPVRCTKGSFAWITSPLSLSRFCRDSEKTLEIPSLSGEQILGGSANLMGSKVILEEYVLHNKGTLPSGIEEAMTGLLPENMKNLAKGRINIVSDELFSHFCEFACEVVTRIRIEDETGVVAKGGLFNQEQVPSETVFYTCLMAQDGKGKEHKDKDAKSALTALLCKIEARQNLIQVGGDATTGLGFCTVTEVL